MMVAFSAYLRRHHKLKQSRIAFTCREEDNYKKLMAKKIKNAKSSLPVKGVLMEGAALRLSAAPASCSQAIALMLSAETIANLHTL